MRTNIIQDMLLITNKENYLSGDLDLNFTGSGEIFTFILSF
jgi:hypothetical protein